MKTDINFIEQHLVLTLLGHLAFWADVIKVLRMSSFPLPLLWIMDTPNELILPLPLLSSHKFGWTHLDSKRKEICMVSSPLIFKNTFSPNAFWATGVNGVCFCCLFSSFLGSWSKFSKNNDKFSFSYHSPITPKWPLYCTEITILRK